MNPPRARGRMRAARSFVAALLACAMLAGCARRPAPSSIDDSASTTEAVVDPAPTKPDAPATTDHDASVDESDPRPQLADPRRLILLTAGGPLVLHLQIHVDGEPQGPALARLLDEAVKLAAGESADAPSAGQWATLVERPQFASGILGNAPFADAASRKRVVEQFDLNRDKRVQRAELAAFLARDSARGHPFTVDWALDALVPQKWSSPLFVLLDVNQDRRLSSGEITAAPVRLRSRDVDDNDAVTMADFRPPQLANRPTRYRRDRRPARAFELRQFSLDSIYYTLSDLYEAGGRLGPDSFALTPGLFAQLDADEDTIVTQRELGGLIAARPDLVVKVNYPAAKSDGAPPSLELVAASDDLAAAAVMILVVPGRLTLELPGSRLDVLVVDQTDDPERIAAASALFATADADDNDQLDAQELATAGPTGFVSFEEIDEDQNGQISLDEWKQAVSGRSTYRDHQVQARLGEAADPLFSWLDARPDGRLTSRELSGSAARLALLDENEDGFVAAAEIPERLFCSIVRGSRATDAGARPDETLLSWFEELADDAPSWLRAMDVNSDGEISRREFLGTAAQFDALDTDDDGYIDADEGRAPVDDDRPPPQEK